MSAVREVRAVQSCANADMELPGRSQLMFPVGGVQKREFMGRRKIRVKGSQRKSRMERESREECPSPYFNKNSKLL